MYVPKNPFGYYQWTSTGQDNGFKGTASGQVVYGGFGATFIAGGKGTGTIKAPLGEIK